MIGAAQFSIEELARRVLSLRRLAGALDSPLRLSLAPDEPSIELLNRIALRGEVREFESLAGPPALTSFEHVAAARLFADTGAMGLARPSLAGLEAHVSIEPLVDGVRAAAFGGLWSSCAVQSADGASIRAYAGGRPGGAPIVIAAPCGMPIELAEHWIAALGGHYRVITWESRGLFGACDNFDSLGYGIDTQAQDALAVMDHFAVERAHLMGLCGGAVIAIAAAGLCPERFSSMSLWYGDYDLGAASQKTRHQRDLIRLMAMVRKSRKEAASLQKLFRDPSMIANVRPNVAHLVLYPYANAELLYRYAILNGAIMETDIAARLASIGLATLVVTSDDDATAHPAGSRAVATGLRGGTLHVEPHGDHLSLFEPSVERAALAVEFIDAHDRPLEKVSAS